MNIRWFWYLPQGNGLEVKTRFTQMHYTLLNCWCAVQPRSRRQSVALKKMGWCLWACTHCDTWIEWSDHIIPNFTLCGHDCCIQCNDCSKDNLDDTVDTGYSTIVWLSRYFRLMQQHNMSIMAELYDWIKKLYCFRHNKYTVLSTVTLRSNYFVDLAAHAWW